MMPTLLWVCQQVECKRTILTSPRRRNVPVCLGFGWTHGPMLKASDLPSAKKERVE